MPEDIEQPHFIFGYGSIIWRPCFPFVSRRVAYVRGFVRRFWQTSDDHRGTCELPGVVCCILPVEETRKYEDSVDEVVHGVVFELAKEKRDEILAELDRREKNGYVRRTVDVYCTESHLPLGKAFVYVCDSSNPGFKPESDPHKIARQIAAAVGPSGTNVEYILQLWQALRRENISDVHIELLVAELLPMLQRCSDSLTLLN